MSDMAADLPKIAILGAGAVGSLIAARLVQAGGDPLLVSRGKRLAALRNEGLLFSDGELPLQRLPVRSAPAEEADIQDVIMIALKAHDIPAALADLAPMIGERTTIVPLVNGIPWWYFQPNRQRAVHAIDPYGAVASTIDPARIVGAVLFLTSTMRDDGAVHVQGPERLVLGPIADLLPREEEALLAPLRRAFAQTRTSATFSDDIRRDVWAKVALNLATNPLSVVGDATLYEQFHDPALRPLVVAVLNETIAVARALGVEPRLAIDEMLAVGEKAGPFYSSMAQDFARGNRLELEAIAVSVLDLAEEQDVPMPMARMISDLCAFRASKRTAG